MTAITSSGELRDSLRQMLAVLESERQALASLDLEGILGASGEKDTLCDFLEGSSPALVDEECRALLEAARRMNEINRQIRNLLAANVSARLDALSGRGALYRPSAGKRAAYAYTNARP